MAVRKQTEDSFVVDGSRKEWLPRVCRALETGRFTKVDASDSLYRVTANYKTLTLWSRIEITLAPEGEHRTKIRARATANADNVYAVFRSPGRTILDRFAQNL